MIDQTALIHDVLSLSTDFHLSGVAPDDTVLDYRWLLSSSTARACGPVAAWRDQVWHGVRAD